MMPIAYYNENDAFAAAWLRELIKAGHIAPGDVDQRSVTDVRASDLVGYTQCHFFAGIGVWSYALRRAGWADNREVWTGSCPCQPFSAAGSQGGFGDGRHLWPHWSGLIGERRPRAVFGEQVSSADGLAWLDFVCSDLEAADYAVGAIDTCAAGVGAPHIRQRLYFVAYADTAGLGARTESQRHDQKHHAQSRGLAGVGHGADTQRDAGRSDEPERETQGGAADGRARTSGVALGNTQQQGLQGLARHGGEGNQPGRERPDPGGPTATAGADGYMGNPEGGGQRIDGSAPWVSGYADQPNATNGFWRACDWLPCRDGKARPVEPGTFPLAHGAPARVGRLRGYGNAINAEAAKEFITAAMGEMR